MKILIIGKDQDRPIFEQLVAINDNQALFLDLSFYALPKLSDKLIVAFSNDYPNTPIIAIIKSIPTLIKIDNSNVVKSYLNWQSLTKRIVSAGRKSELLLQACKLTADMAVVDGTAGFGHDGLILASTGAKIMMVENNALVALLLLFEKQIMNHNPNWQKLLDRIDIYHGNFLDNCFVSMLPKVDLVYLDPMFPTHSYAAKVNKNMQILHDLANPPSASDEWLFLKIARHQLLSDGKIIVKRPISAPFLADDKPSYSIANDAIRFDRYDIN